MKLNRQQEKLKRLCREVLSQLDGLENEFEGAAERLLESSGALLVFLSRLHADSQQKDGVPPFLPKYYFAFAALMLYKLGGMETITLEKLEKFPVDSVPDVIYNHDKKAYVMKLKEASDPRNLVVVAKKRLRKVPKIVRN